jgi:hypothetical protein
MFRRLRSTLLEATPVDPATGPDDALDPADGQGPVAPASRLEPGLAALPIIGITRRRLAAGVAALLAAWIVIVFVRQVGEASAASAFADEMTVGNAERQALVAALERELDQIARPRYVDQQARGYGLGTPREIPFTLAAGAPPLPDDAPGSAALRVGVERDDPPLERWLTVLFGPDD